MSFSLLVVDHRPAVVDAWDNAFRGIDVVTVRAGTLRGLFVEPGLDALIFPALLAHEKLGGIMRIGASQILSTQPERTRISVPWVVTTPPRAAQMVRTRKTPLRSELKLEPIQPLSPVELVILTFTEVFHAITRFNSGGTQEPLIEHLGVDLSMHGMGAPATMTAEAEAVRALLHSLPDAGCTTAAQLKTLYRPVGQAELDLIRASGWRAFPPRLPIQPIFYPVLTEEYAIQIARDWNTRDPNSGYAGYVLRFRVQAAFLARYPVQQVGAAQHREYWIPAEELTAFNAAIVGLIEILHEFRAPANGSP